MGYVARKLTQTPLQHQAHDRRAPVANLRGHPLHRLSDPQCRCHQHASGCYRRLGRLPHNSHLKSPELPNHIPGIFAAATAAAATARRHQASERARESAHRTIERAGGRPRERCQQRGPGYLRFLEESVSALHAETCGVNQNG